MNIYILIGIGLLIVTLIEYLRGKTDADAFVGSWLEWVAELFEIKRETLPELYWIILLLQLVAGIACIIYGAGYVSDQ